MKTLGIVLLFINVHLCISLQGIRPIHAIRSPPIHIRRLSIALQSSVSRAINDSPQENEGISVGTGSMVKEIVALAIPALGGMLLDPIMSLVDTACVGQISHVQLACLAPCTSIYQLVFVMFYFLSITTTTLIAANPLVTDDVNTTEINRRIDENEKVLSCAAFLALICGVIATSVLCWFSKSLISLAGCSDPEMILLGESYLRIRALGLPFVLVATVLQGASIGCQDAVTPLKIFVSAGLLNLIGDIWLTLRLGWGISGTAIATVGAQITATVYYVYRNSREKSRNNRKEIQLRWRGFPERNLLQRFGFMAVALFLKCMTTMSCYSLMTKTASAFGAVQLAAHQVTLQVWWLLSYFPEPASTVAQSLVARDMKDRPSRVSKLVKVLYGVSLCCGILVAIATYLTLSVPQISRLFVAEPSVISFLMTTAVPAMLAQVLCSVGSLSDGLAVGCGEFYHLPINSAIGLISLFTTLKFTNVRTISGIWFSSSAFFITRLMGHFAFSKKIRTYVIGRN
jgi:putative MATE family efflux protein